MFDVPCQYVRFSEYDWKLVPDHMNPPGWPALLWNATVYSLIAAFESSTISIAIYLHIQLFYLFKGRKTLYFWYILTITWGTLLHLLGLILEQVRHKDLPTSLLLNVGWVLMTTGFAFVLYSRLHLLNPSKRLLHLVLVAIIVDVFLFHGPVFVVTSMAAVKLTQEVYEVYKVVTYIEIGLSVQEAALATLYIYLFIQFTRDSLHDPATRKALVLLLAAEFMVLTTDVLLCILLYLKYYLPRQMIQTWVSVVKLQIEFVILEQLMKFSRRHAGRMDVGVPEFVTVPVNLGAGSVEMVGADGNSKV